MLTTYFCGHLYQALGLVVIRVDSAGFLMKSLNDNPDSCDHLKDAINLTDGLTDGLSSLCSRIYYANVIVTEFHLNGNTLA